MIQAAAQPLTFDDFVGLYPEDGDHYELRHGEIVRVQLTGSHEEAITSTRRKLDFEIECLNLPCFIPQPYLMKPYREAEGYLPDIVVLDRVKEDPCWQKYSSISTGNSVKLIIEVVGTNWQDDYLTKLPDHSTVA